MFIEIFPIEKIIMRVIFLLIFLCICVGSCSYFNKKLGLPNDNIIEELIESQIERSTGLDIDLTPE